MGSHADPEPAAGTRSPSEREAAADERDRRADQRDTAADERELRADQRDAVADERELRADQRDAVADERELRADQRDAAADERDWRFDEQMQAVKAVAERLAKESQDLIDKSRALLTASRDDVKRHTAAKQPGPRGPRHRQKQAPTGTAAASEPHLAGELIGPAATIERSIALRTQLSATVAALAATEEEVARIHDDIAARRRTGTDTYRRTADEARTRAHQLRELEQHLRG